MQQKLRIREAVKSFVEEEEFEKLPVQYEIKIYLDLLFLDFEFATAKDVQSKHKHLHNH